MSRLRFNYYRVERLLNNRLRETLRNLTGQAHGTGATKSHSLPPRCPWNSECRSVVLKHMGWRTGLMEGRKPKVGVCCELRHLFANATGEPRVIRND